MISHKTTRLMFLALSTFAVVAISACGGTTVEKQIVEVPVEKIVTKEVPVEVERIVTKEVEVQVEKIVTKEVPVEVEVEKIITKEVEVEVIKEKTVIKEVAAPAPAAYKTEPTGSGSITIATAELAPLIQDPRKDIRATGGIGKDFSVYETLVRAPHVAPPAFPPQDHTLYSADDGGLAKAWTINEDFTSITFTLHDNVRWHSNGGDWGYLDAADVAWTYNQAFALDSVNNGAEEIGPEMKKGFSITGPMEVVQHIEALGFDPTWAWLQGNAGFNGIVIVNADAYVALGPSDYAKNPIGTGRYMATNWVGDDQLELQAVKDHWSGTDAIVGNITVVNMPEEATREAALRAGEVDIGQLGPQVVNTTAADIGGRVQEIGIARPSGFMMAGNYWSTTCPGCEGGVMPRPGFDEAIASPAEFPWVGNPDDAANMESARNVRFAMQKVVDQEAIIAALLEGQGRPIYAWQNILPDDASHKDSWKLTTDVAAAKQLMIDAGYPDGFDAEYWIPKNFWGGLGTEEAAQYLVEQWRTELGINGTIDRTEYSVRRPQTVDKTINVPFVHGINWMPGSSSARYICAAGGHIVGITLEQEICDTGLANTTENSLEQRIINNNVVQDYLSKEMLFIPMFQSPASLFVVSSKIDAWNPWNEQDVFPNNMESITLK